MNSQIMALIFQEGGKVISAMIKNRPIKQTMIEEPKVTTIGGKATEITTEELPIEESKATSIEVGCVPCAIGHLGTCTGGLNEAMRFAKKDGIESSEVIDRVNMCLDELNIMERIDLRPELTIGLPNWEKELANKALTSSRSIRHGLEGLTNVSDLEKVAANTQTARQEIGRAWFKQRIGKMSPEDKKKIAEKAMEKLEI